jgi:hypothetical protein
MDPIIAYCGIVCTDCPAWKATKANDQEALKELAANWSKEFGVEISPEDCRCVGCLGDKGPQIGYLEQCEMRKCAVPKGVENCAHCDDYACETLQKWFESVPQSKEKLDSIRESL